MRLPLQGLAGKLSAAEAEAQAARGAAAAAAAAAAKHESDLGDLRYNGIYSIVSGLFPGGHQPLPQHADPSACLLFLAALPITPSKATPSPLRGI